ncbi:FkbM family methyltransferase [Agilicoccus flavus]|uniref:FkbM family methyltransferase n=1 Tax=Agilicoccus flavus TaxID=2775968 RepID=UPI001CF699CC|nr:FkbM family methyltransferase [Agilicoccus flavus]
MSDAKAVYVGDGRLLVQTVWGFHLYCPSREMSIVPHLALSGSFENELASYLMTAVKPGDTVIDIGANIGVFTTLLGHLVGSEGQVLAFEPVLENYMFLRDNVESNWLGQRVSTHRMALGDANGEIRIKSDPRWGGLSSAMTVDDGTMTMGVGDDTSHVEQVDCFVLDDIIEGVDDISLVKIDVEGAELRVFRGMLGLLRANRVARVVFECIAPRMKSDWKPFVSLLNGLENDGWTFSLLGSAGTSPVPATVSAIAAHGYLYHVLMEHSTSVSDSEILLQPALIVGPEDLNSSK